MWPACHRVGCRDLSKLFFRVTGLIIVAPAFFSESDTCWLVTRFTVTRSDAFFRE
jgi:hypothetical protein